MAISGSPLGSTAADYLAQLQALTPTGGAFPTDDAANWTLLLTALALTYARIDASAVNLLNEIYPDTTEELLPNWERIAGLPNACTPLGTTIAARRQALIATLTSQGGQSKAYFIALALSLGYTITIDEFFPFQTGLSSVGSYLANASAEAYWVVNAPAMTEVFFKAGVSAAGEALASFGNSLLECVFNLYKPAHSVALYNFGGSLI